MCCEVLTWWRAALSLIIRISIRCAQYNGLNVHIVPRKLELQYTVTCFFITSLCHVLRMSIFFVTVYGLRFVTMQRQTDYTYAFGLIKYRWELLSVLPIIKLLSSVTSTVLQDCQMCKCTGETEKGPRVGPTGSTWDIFLRSPEVKLLSFCALGCTSCYLSPKYSLITLTKKTLCYTKFRIIQTNAVTRTIAGLM